MNVVMRGLTRFVAMGGKYGLDIVCSSKTHKQISVSHRQYLPHWRYPSRPRMYMNIAAAP